VSSLVFSMFLISFFTVNLLNNLSLFYGSDLLLIAIVFGLFGIKCK